MKAKNDLLIGITGRRQSGKSLVADLLIKRYEKHFIQSAVTGFSDAIIEDLAVYTGGYENTIIKNKEILRPILQLWGDLYRQHLMDRMTSFIKDLESPCLCIVHDIRLIMESVFIKTWGGIILKIERPLCMKNSPYIGQQVLDIDNHITEKEVDRITPDIVVHNDSSSEVLKDHGMNQVFEWLDKLIGIC